VVVTQTRLRRLTSELSLTINQQEKQQELAITEQREFLRPFMREIKVGVDTIKIHYSMRCTCWKTLAIVFSLPTFSTALTPAAVPN
jgi:hypothetical protein